MPATSTDWNKTNSAKTLEKLRKDYAGYTDNEVYAIWCVNNQVVPLDDRGKLQLEAWREQGAEDGKLLANGGFKVSRAIYGRAQKAQKGVRKPKGKPRGRAAAARGAATPASPAAKPRLSRAALTFAQRYDAVAKAIEAIQEKRQEVKELLQALNGTSTAIAQDLAEQDSGAKEILKEAGAL